MTLNLNQTSYIESHLPI